jgi:hypothetical protein
MKSDCPAFLETQVKSRGLVMGITARLVKLLRRILSFALANIVRGKSYGYYSEKDWGSSPASHAIVGRLI